DRVVVGVGERVGELLDERDGLEVVEVHLPVARHQRGPRHQSSSNTARPGRLLPSRYSRLAPPPVEMWPNRASSMPSARTAAALSPPPTTVSASSPSDAMASATPRVPAANGASSNT